MTARTAMGSAVAVVAASLGVLVSTGVAHADTYTVNTTADHTPDKFCNTAPDCTLREAVDAAGSADTIVVPAGTYILSAATGFGELVLVGDHITGAGARTTFIQAAKTRVLRAADGSSTIAGVTIRNGNGVSATSNGFGGGIFVGSGTTLFLTNTTVSGNRASMGGGGIAGPGSIGLIGSTVSGNQASAGRLTRGGGIFAGGTLAIGNSTVSGNTALDSTGAASQGGGIYAGGALNSINTTIAGNTATEGGGIYVGPTPAGATQQFANTIVGINTGGSCAGAGLATDTSHNSLARDGTCQFTGAGDLQDTNPLLGALANNGGGTDTHALPPNSPAVDEGSACATADQRGFAREGNGTACDVGAYEYRPPKLTVTTAVINDSGGTLTPGGVTTRVLLGKTDVTGSPAPGSATGTTYALAPGTYAVTAGTVFGYTRTIGLDCAANGSITLQEGQIRVCQITENDVAPTLEVTTTVINDSGGTLTAAGVLGHVRQDGVDVFNSPQAGSAAGADYMLSAGTYSVSPDAVIGYTFTVGGACVNGNVTLVVGDAKTCTITANDIAPTLRVTTVVVNGPNGNATPNQFSVHVRSGTAEVSGSPAPGNPNGTLYTLSAGGYGVSADGVAGYSVAGSGACAANGAVTLQVGDNKVCTVTATAGAPTLRVVTQVINDNGGTRPASTFTAHVRDAGVDVTGSPQVGAGAPGTPYGLGIGDYVVSADSVPGYAFSMSGECSATGAITLRTADDRTCNIVANDVAPTLTVITTVLNDNGRTLTPAGFNVHVRKSGADIAGSPRPGSSSGSKYSLAAGTYSVGSDPATGYTTAVGGACAGGGTVTLQVGDAKTCTVAANDTAVQPSGPSPPVLHKTANLFPGPGNVRVKFPGSDEFVTLDEGEQVPLGTIVDTKNGRITLIAAADGNGNTATANFYGGIFKLGQTKSKTPTTVLRLVEKLTGCKAKGKATIAKKKKPKKRRLWGDGKGRFATRGKHSAATVVGTKWLVEDRCTSTLTKVARGKVKVRDFAKKKTVLVKAGKTYVARAR